MSLIALRTVASICVVGDFRPADFAGDDDAVGRRQRLAGDADLIGIDARLRPLAEEEIDDFIGNSIANLVRMPFGHGFAGELVILTSHIHDSPAGAPAAATLCGLQRMSPGRAGAAFASGRSVRQADFGWIVRFTERSEPSAVVVRRRQRNHQINDPAAHPRVADTQKGPIELQALSRGKEIHHVGLRRFFGETLALLTERARPRRNTQAILPAHERYAGDDWR